MTAEKYATFTKAFSEGMNLIIAGCEIRSAFKQTGSDNGIEWGEDMGEFVRWAEDKLGVSHITA